MGNKAGSIGSHILGAALAPMTASFAALGGAEAHGIGGAKAGAEGVVKNPAGYASTPQGRGQFLAGVSTAAAAGLGAGAVAPSGIDAAALSAEGAYPGATVVGAGGAAGAGAAAGASGLFKLGQKAPKAPGEAMLAKPTSQARDQIYGGGWDPNAAKALAESAGGTLFSTPTPWWQSTQVGNQGPRVNLVGA